MLKSDPCQKKRKDAEVRPGFCPVTCSLAIRARRRRALRFPPMLQRGAHALLFLMCSPLLVRGEDVRMRVEPTHPRAITHAQVH